MRSAILALALILFSRAAFAEQAWIGKISDSACKAKHESGDEMGEEMNDHDCTLACVKGGSEFVLVSDGNVYKIANQALADVRKHAGEKVTVTGELKDGSITVASVRP